MTASRAEIALAFAAVLFAGAAAAQTTTGQSSATAAPQALTPGPASSPSTSGFGRDTAPIEVNSLGNPDGPAVGLLEPTNGGMALDIWSGSDRAVIDDLLARMPLATPVRSVRLLSRKLILTVADAPVGQAPHAFQTVRLEALLNAGLIREAARLASQIQLKSDPEFARVQAEAILLGGSAADACSDATATRDSDATPFWMELRAYCYAVSGQDDLLELTRGVMRAQGSDDKAFEILLDDVREHKVLPPGDIHDPNAVHVFLLRQLGLPISSSLSARFGLAASVVALFDVRNSPLARADAASQALHTGWISSADLDAVADQQVFSMPQFSGAESAAAGLPFFQGQALVRQAVAISADFDEKARLLAIALRTGREMQVLPVAAGMQEKALAAIVPSPRFHAYVPSFARALLLAHNVEAAESWQESLGAANVADRPLSAALAVEAELVAPDPARAAKVQSALFWLAGNAVSVQPEGGGDEQRYDAMAVLLCDALGEPLPQGVTAAVLLAQKWPGRIIPPVTRQHLEELRGIANRKGEAILTILDTVGVLGPGDLAPGDAAFLVRDLKAEGEPDAARALAADALLLYQPQS